MQIGHDKFTDTPRNLWPTAWLAWRSFTAVFLADGSSKWKQSIRRMDTGSRKTNTLNGGLTYRALSHFSGWIVYIQVPALDETVEVIKSLVGSVVRPKTAANDGSLGMPPWVIFLAETEKVT